MDSRDVQPLRSRGPEEQPGDGAAGAARFALARTLREPELWLTVAGVLLALLPVLAGGRTLFFRDLCLQHAGTARLIQEGFRESWFPLLDPFLNGGQPLLGNPNHAVLYPSRVLYLVLSPATALTWEIALHLVLAGAGAYLVGRALGLSRIAATISGLVFALSGFTLSLTTHLGRLMAYSLLPLAFLALHRVATGSRPRAWSAAAAGVVAVQWLSGALEILLLEGVLFLLWQLAMPGTRGTRSRRVVVTAVLCCASVGLAAIQVVPAAVMVSRSSRSGGLGVDDALGWSVDPRRLVLESLLPGVLGPVDTASPATDYWGSALVDFGFPYALSLYLGAFVVALAILGASGARGSPLSTGERRMLATVAAVAAVLACGRHIPGSRWILDALPFLAVIRFPVKLLALGGLPLAVLAGSGAQHAMARNGRRSRLVAGSCLMVLGALMLLVALAIGTLPESAGRLLAQLFTRPGPDVVAGVMGSLLHAALVCVVGACVLLAPWGRRGNAWRGAACAAIVLCDLLAASGRAILSAPRELIDEAPPLVEPITSLLRGGRFYREDDPLSTSVSFPVSSAAAAAAWRLSILTSYLGASYLIPMVFHPDDGRLAEHRLAELGRRLQALPWRQRLPILAAARVTVVMSPSRLMTPGLRRVLSVPNRSDVEYHVYANLSAMPRAWMVAAREVVDSAEKALGVVSGPGFDPARVVVLERDEIDDAPDVGFPPEGIETGVGVGTVNDWFRAVPDEWIFDVTVNRAGYLVMSEPWSPAWTVRVDGARQPVLRANFAFSAIHMLPGRHRVHRVYAPEEVRWGGVISLLSALGLATGLALWRPWRDPQG